MNAAWQAQRSTSQLTLGKLIDRLKQLPPNSPVQAITNAHSYRGYYCDLAFELTGEMGVAKDSLAVALSVLGEVFTGYKGGDYLMDESTPVWIANYGECGQKIMAVRDDGTFELAEDS